MISSNSIKTTSIASSLVLIAALLLPISAQAGRPLTVDDANVNDAGDGHVETWITRGANGVSSWTVAPAYAVVENIELAAGLVREQRSGILTQNIQAKFRMTPMQDNGCNFGVVVGYSQTEGASSQPYVNGLLSCNSEAMGSLHTNLGAVNAFKSQRVKSWGIAWERVYGDLTFHIEKFGMENAPSTIATGARFNVLPDLQLDTSVGRTQKQNVITLGFKWMF